MLLRIDNSSPKPIYQQIIDGIKLLIDQGSLGIDHTLPSTRSLAKKLGVNRSTVNRAYEELQALGYLQSRPGSYNRVQKRLKEVDYDPKRKSVISWEKVSNDSAQKLYETFLLYSPESPNQENEINLSQLSFDPRLYPVEEFKRCINNVLWDSSREFFQYGKYKGYPPLCRQIAQRLRLHGISVSEDEVLITNGAQQGIDLIIRMLTTPEKKVALESPTYANVIPLLKFYKIQILEIPMKPDGMDLDLLKKALKKEEVSFIYTIPNFQNPTGITTSHKHRELLLTLCQKYKVPIVEDGFEEDMKYFGKVPMPVKSIDEKNIVIYLGTFSKTLFPGLRLGWITANKDCINRLTAIKRFSDLSSGNLVQMVLHKFLERGYYEKHLKRLHRIFRRRMQVALETMERSFPDTVYWTRPSGGYTFWVKMPIRLSESQLNTTMSKHKVTVSPGGYYFLKKNTSEYFRICIASCSENEIKEGISRIGKVLHKISKET